MQYLLLIMIIIIILFIYAIYIINKPKKIYIATEKIILQQNKLLQCMQHVHNLFTLYNIWYNIAFGTLLGAVRHKTIIPWDDDIDLFVFHKDLDKIENIFNILSKEYNYKIEKDWNTIKIFIDDEIFIDLFVIDNMNNNIIRCLTEETLTKINFDNTFQNTCEEYNYEWWKKNVLEPKEPYDDLWWKKWFGFPQEYLGNKKLYQLNNIQVYGPEYPLKLLHFWYGTDCLTTCKSPELLHHKIYIDSEIISCPPLLEPQL